MGREAGSLAAKIAIVAGMAAIVSAIMGLLTFGSDHWGWLSGPQAATGVPARIQGNWNGDVNVLSIGNVQVNLSLGSGSQGDQVGQISSATIGCQAAVFLDGTSGGGPASSVMLGIVVPSGQSDCELASLFTTATVTLESNDTLQFAVTSGLFSGSCDLSPADS